MINLNNFEKFVRENMVLKKNVFKPNLTSKLCFEVAKKNIHNKSKVLDLGCGSGIIGVLIKKDLKNIELFCSDNHLSSVNLTKKNLKKNNLSAVVKKGNLLDPWRGEKFDYIIDDVSAISSTVAFKSKWFSNNIPLESGEDGTNLSIKIIENAKNFLNKNGILQIPILSLSDTEKIAKVIKKNFKKSKIVKSEKWFLPNEMLRYKTLLKKLKEKKKVNFEEKFGKIICETSIIICKV